MSLVPRSLLMRHRGHSLAEVLVVIGILGLLLTFLLPAVQHARERARSTTCGNNLRQLTFGAQQHEAARRVFPYTSTSWFDARESVPRRYYSVSPHSSLLPFFDSTLDAQFEPNSADDPGWSDSPQHSLSPANQKLTEMIFEAFLCPSDSRLPGATSYRANLGISVEVLPPGGSVEPITQRGAFVNGRSVRASEFRDGLSQTVLFSERAIGDFDPDSYDPFLDIYARTSSIDGTPQVVERCRVEATSNPESEFSFAGANWLFGGWLHTWYNHATTPNSEVPDCGDGPGHLDGGRVVIAARSYHPGGVHAATVDGAVRFVASSVDGKAWSAFGTRDGREVVD